jgi:hypothetical protein
MVLSPVPERRHGPRVARELPLSLHTGQRTLPVRTVDLGDGGALVVSPEALSLKHGIVLANPSSGRRASGWVVRCGTGDVPGTFEVAIRFLEPSPAFWGKPEDA